MSRLLALVALLAACSGPSRPQATAAGPRASSLPAADAPSGDGSGRWLAWSGEGRLWGAFVTARGAGPAWSLDVAGSESWSADGRWLASCAEGFVAARWMGSARPSRVTLVNGGCTSLLWPPQGNTALAFTRGSPQARLLYFTPGEQPNIRQVPFEIALGPGERFGYSERPSWSPSGESFLVKVDAMYERWVDAAKTPGRVRKLVTADGLEALDCVWSPSGRRLACLVAAPRSGQASAAAQRRALALFELEKEEPSSRPLFESPGFHAVDARFVDDERLVLKDRDATRLFHVSGREPPITLSANASDFAVAPAAPRLAYVNHRGLCLREAGAKLGPEQLLVPGPVTGVTWSESGRHLFSHRPDLRAVVVVTDAGTEQQRVRPTPEVGAELVLAAQFSAGSTMLLTRPFKKQEKRYLLEQSWEPLQAWSLRDGSRPELVGPTLGDRWPQLSPDDAALVARPEKPDGVLRLGVLHGTRATFQPLTAVAPGAWLAWQPGVATKVDDTPAPVRPSDPRRERVTLPENHPLTLATAYVRGARECSGVLLDARFVVTADHCLSRERGPVQVVLGRHTSWEQSYAVPLFRIIHHPKVRYVEPLDLFDNDLALLELPEPAPPQAKPLVLAHAGDASPGAEVYLVGFGGDWSVGLSAQPELRHGISQLVAPPSGITAALAWRSPEGAENGGCFGDSGGPVSVQRADRSFALLGIHYGSGGTDYQQACRNTGIAGNLLSERAWLNEAADKLTLSRRGSGPPRARATPF